MKISEELINEQAVVFASRTGAYGPENRVLMERFKKWVCDSGYMTDDAVILGIACDAISQTPPEKCIYEVCLLGEHEASEPWIERGVISGGKYAVTELPHTAEAVALAWQEGIPQLVDAGYKLDFSRPIIERYKKSLVDKGVCEMLFPIRMQKEAPSPMSVNAEALRLTSNTAATDRDASNENIAEERPNVNPIIEAIQYAERQTGSDPETHIDNRNMADVGSRKVHSFQYEHPEL